MNDFNSRLGNRIEDEGGEKSLIKRFSKIINMREIIGGVLLFLGIYTVGLSTRLIQSDVINRYTYELCIGG